MPEKRIRISNVLVQDTEQYRMRPDMFIRSSLTPAFKDGYVALPANAIYGFGTYFGSCSISKWREYTVARDYKLHVTIDGSGSIILYGYSYDPEYKIEIPRVIDEVAITKGKKTYELDIPDGDDLVIGFDIRLSTAGKFYEAWYSVAVDEDQLRDVELSICTTTFQKEPYIKANAKKWERVLAGGIAEDNGLHDHLTVHIVDNGNTLPVDLSDSDRIIVHPNPNTGGAGGFARGMIETLDQEVKATHALMMDDDIKLNEEAVFRTYTLLRIVKDEYSEAFVSGAMLSNQMIDEFVEDIGHIIPSMGGMGAVKERKFMCRLGDVVGNEHEVCNRRMQYAAFWFCCVPVRDIEELGLTMPFFIHGDDCEFGIRKPDRRFMSMNGICVWHDGFTNSKFRANVECYLTLRNLLIIEAINDQCEGLNIIDTLLTKRYMCEIRKYSYAECELMLDALSDYLRGPSYLDWLDNGARLREEGGKLPKQQDIPYPSPVDLDNLDGEIRGLPEQVKMFLTHNGNSLVPESMLRDETVAIPDVFGYYPSGRICWVKHLWLVSPDKRRYTAHDWDRERFEKLEAYRKRLMKRWENERETIAEEWREAAPYLRSVEAWRRRLGLDKTEVVSETDKAETGETATGE